MLVKNGVWTALHRFTMQGDIASMKEFLNKDKEFIHQIDTNFRTPLHIAAEYNQPKAIRLLVNNGADIEKEMPGGLTSLHISTLVESIESVDTLIELGANIDKVDDHGYSSLHMAAEYGNVDIIKLLISNNADDSLLNQDRMTPLCVAIYHDQEESASLLYNLDNSVSSYECLERMPKDIDDIIISFIGDNSTGSEFGYKIILQAS